MGYIVRTTETQKPNVDPKSTCIGKGLEMISLSPRKLNTTGGELPTTYQGLLITESFERSWEITNVLVPVGRNIVIRLFLPVMRKYTKKKDQNRFTDANLMECRIIRHDQKRRSCKWRKLVRNCNRSFDGILKLIVTPFLSL